MRRATAGRAVTIEADKVFLAAGAYASTMILRRSGLAGAKPGVRTVGRRFSGNMGTPVFARFAEPHAARRGQQVGYMINLKRERLVIETAFAPPPAFSLQAPQWGARQGRIRPGKGKGASARQELRSAGQNQRPLLMEMALDAQAQHQKVTTLERTQIEERVRMLATWRSFDMGCHYRRFRPSEILPSIVKSAAHSAQLVSDGTRPLRARMQGS